MTNTKQINILVTNDDGVHAEGIFALKSALESIGTVWVVAPERPRSACGHSITLHKPLRLNKTHLPDGAEAYACSGTPSDCVSLGIRNVIPGKVDLVFSGINRGPNLGWDMTYSGTVSAAMEGVILGVPSIAISLASHEDIIHFDFAAKFAAFLGQQMLNHELPADTLLNVNVPNVPGNQINGIAVTKQGRRTFDGTIDKRIDPQGRAYYWLGGDVAKDCLEEGTDLKAIADKKISVTPVHLDLTGYGSLDQLATWGLEDFNNHG